MELIIVNLHEFKSPGQPERYLPHASMNDEDCKTFASLSLFIGFVRLVGFQPLLMMTKHR